MLSVNKYYVHSQLSAKEKTIAITKDEKNTKNFLVNLILTQPRPKFLLSLPHQTEFVKQ